MSKPTTYDDCTDRCEDISLDETTEAFDRCWDQCDERFAVGKEPAGVIAPPTPEAKDGE